MILETLHRYFHVERFVPLGGAIAYPIITHNDRLFAREDKEEQAAFVDKVLEADEAFLAEHPDSTLFAYIVATPNKKVLEQTEDLAGWEQEENDREDRPGERRGVLPPDRPAKCLRPSHHRTRRVGQLRAQVANLEGQLLAIRRDPLVARLTTLRGSRLAGESAALPDSAPSTTGSGRVPASRSSAPDSPGLL